jgi:ABC-type multidrug transport system fused ATPase/permease subunit
LLKRFVDQGLVGSGGLGGLFAMAAAIAGARELAAYWAGRFAVGAATGLIGDLQNRVFSHLQSLSLGFFRKHRPGDLMERLFYDVERATNLITGVTATAIEAPLRLLGLFALLWSLHPRMAMGTAGVLIPAVIVGRLIARRLRRVYHDVSEDLSSLYHTAYETLGAAELLQSYGREADAARDFAVRNGALVARQTRLYRMQAMQGPASQALRLLAVLLAFLYGSAEIAAGRLTPGGFAAVLVAAYAFLGSLDSFVSLPSVAQGGLASAERLFELIDARPTIVAPPHAPRATFAGALTLDDVTFAYEPDGAPVLDHLSLILRPGEKVALVGRSGSGKTTLVRLLLRLYDPRQGRVAFDGLDARTLDVASVRGLFAVALQEGLIVDLTIAENIALGRAGATRAEIEEVARAAGLDGTLGRLPAGLDTRVGRGGASLSGGERQRVSLARAMLRDAPIVLLDEATSALDGESEARLQDWLLGTGARTTLTIAHRLSTLQSAGRILVLDGGRIVEDGTHEALLERAGLYRKLYEDQALRL